MNTENSQSPRAVLYLRVARSKREAQAAIEAQRRACERRATELGLTVVDEYIDHGSAHTFHQRPGLQMMLSDLKARGDVRYVMAYDHDRIARGSYVYTQVVWAIEEAGARLEMATLGPHQRPSQPEQMSIGDVAARQHPAPTGRQPCSDESDERSQLDDQT